MDKDVQKTVIKNEFYTMEIDDIGTGGEGIGKIDGFTMFVSGALPGDKIYVKAIKVMKKYGFGKLIEIITPSPDRCQVACKTFNQCGGCQLQHLSYEAQLRYKKNKVINDLKRIGGIADIEDCVADVIGMEVPYHYRNKVQLPVSKIHGKIEAGFYATKSHRVVPVVNCNIQNEINNWIKDEIISFMNDFNIEPYDEIKHRGVIRHIVTRISKETNEISVTIVINRSDLKYKKQLIERLCKNTDIASISLSINREKTNVIFGNELRVIWGAEYIKDSIGDITFKISPRSFYQVNPIQTEKLYAKALEFANLNGQETVWDAYCGIGTISLFLAREAKKVYGVEIVEDAILNARDNAKLNDIDNVEFFVGKAEEVITDKYNLDGIKADVIVVDPPRKGCDEALIHTMIEMQPDRIVYVSCDPGTMSRDVKKLVEGGYEVDRVQPVDMFPHTPHVECCSLLTKKINNSMNASDVRRFVL